MEPLFSPFGFRTGLIWRLDDRRDCMTFTKGRLSVGTTVEGSFLTGSNLIERIDIFLRCALSLFFSLSHLHLPATQSVGFKQNL